uniref:Uncharacterized protein n=1 Tax=Anopheles funestus TaxID=62324 RepID=A0A4Y0BL34_ANOFN
MSRPFDAGRRRQFRYQLLHQDYVACVFGQPRRPDGRTHVSYRESKVGQGLQSISSWCWHAPHLLYQRVHNHIRSSEAQLECGYSVLQSRWQQQQRTHRFQCSSFQRFLQPHQVFIVGITADRRRVLVACNKEWPLFCRS